MSVLWDSKIAPWRRYQDSESEYVDSELESPSSRTRSRRTQERGQDSHRPTPSCTRTPEFRPTATSTRKRLATLPVQPPAKARPSQRKVPPPAHLLQPFTSRVQPAAKLTPSQPKVPPPIRLLRPSTLPVQPAAEARLNQKVPSPAHWPKPPKIIPKSAQHRQPPGSHYPTAEEGRPAALWPYHPSSSSSEGLLNGDCDEVLEPPRRQPSSQRPPPKRRRRQPAPPSSSSSEDLLRGDCDDVLQPPCRQTQAAASVHVQQLCRQTQAAAPVPYQGPPSQRPPPPPPRRQTQAAAPGRDQPPRRTPVMTVQQVDEAVSFDQLRTTFWHTLLEQDPTESPQSWEAWRSAWAPFALEYLRPQVPFELSIIKLIKACVNR
jgi:hypothetical protein